MKPSTKTRNILSVPAAPVLLIALLAFSYCVQPSQTLVIPSELPSVLSVIYSNIPPIKKGTDSRVGFGFRLGEHADFQVMLELGPQTHTRPIGDQESDSDSTYSKRQLDKNELRKQYWRQQAKLKQQQLDQQQPATSTERNAANWLQNWSSDMNANNGNNNNNKVSVKTTKSTKKHNNPDGMPTMPLVAEDALKQLQRLYKLATTTSTELPPVKKLPYLGGSLNLGPPAGFTQPQQDLENFKELKSKKEVTKELMDVSVE